MESTTEPSTYSQYYSDNCTVRIPQLHQGHSASCHDGYYTKFKTSKARNYRSKTIIEDLEDEQSTTEDELRDYETPPDIPVRRSKKNKAKNWFAK